MGGGREYHAGPCSPEIADLPHGECEGTGRVVWPWRGEGSRLRLAALCGDEAAQLHEPVEPIRVLCEACELREDLLNQLSEIEADHSVEYPDETESEAQEAYEADQSEMQCRCEELEFLAWLGRLKTYPRDVLVHGLLVTANQVPQISEAQEVLDRVREWLYCPCGEHAKQCQVPNHLSQGYLWILVPLVDLVNQADDHRDNFTVSAYGLGIQLGLSGTQEILSKVLIDQALASKTV